ncbi:MAG: hypothetical protein AB7V43_18900 [Acidimicrobiia bacterium]
MGALTGVGSVPHDNAQDAVTWVLRWCPVVPFVPQRSATSPAEAMINQVLTGLSAVSASLDGTVHGTIPEAALRDPPHADLNGPEFESLRAFVDVLAPAGDVLAPAGSVAVGDGDTGEPIAAVKWQLAGPVTVGLALARAGLRPDAAMAFAQCLVQDTLIAVHALLGSRLPGMTQVMVLDEPSFALVTCPGFPVAPDVAIDALSTCLATLQGRAVVGVHCCAEVDLAALLAAGPELLSVTVEAGRSATPEQSVGAGHLARFIERGGTVAWGVVPTDRPIGERSSRWWRELSTTWDDLTGFGLSRGELAARSLVTPACGLALHTVDQADRVMALAAAVASRIP